MITGNSNEENEIECFDRGTNLFHKKPINTRLLLSQINSLTENNSENLYIHADLIIDDNNKTVTWNGNRISLTKNEYQTLLLLIKRKGKVTTKDHIIDNLYYDGGEVLETSIDTLISRLRKKLNEAGVSKNYLKTVRGFGYKLNEEPL